MNSLDARDRIRTKFRPNVICEAFDDTPWRERAAVLASMGLDRAEEVALEEVTKGEAISHLSTVLSTELCYGTKRAAAHTAKCLSDEFLSSFHFQSRYYTNCDKLRLPLESGFRFSHLCSSATIDTGIIIRLTNTITGICWACDVD